MVERGSVQHGGRVDDELAAGVGPLTHGATISAREREDLDPEAPTADESPLVASGDHEDLTGGINYREALERSEIARWLLPSAFPCDTFTLREMASAQGAPDHLIEQVAALPTAGWYEAMGEVWIALGGHTEHRESNVCESRDGLARAAGRVAAARISTVRRQS